MRKKAIGLGLAALLIFPGCGKQGGTEKMDDPREPEKSAYTVNDVDPSLVQASNGFGMTLAEKLMAEHPGENVMLSPLSLSAALALAATGAAGGTGEEMRAALGLDGKSSDEIGAGYRVLVDLLSHSGGDGVEINVASSLWLKEGKPFLEAFVDRSRDDFGATVRRVNFADPQTLQAINEWTEDATGGRIKRMLPSVEAEAALYVLNAVYFNGAWTKPFNAKATADGSFHVSDSETVPVQMMSSGGYFQYAKKDGYEAVRLPYGKREAAYMAIVLPDKGVPVSELSAKLAADPQRLTEEYEARQGRIEMPKLRLEYDADLEAALRDSGIKLAFEPSRSDFSAMAPEPPNLFISRVTHRTALSVDEEGTEAAAATALEMLAGAAPPDQPFQLTVDRPFIAAIVDRDTGCILFAGAVFDPGDDG
ncbi:serpin family protein [Cohnella cellulosilytica]|uniref:Serpin family protein n=1 Tax=Cohnella cellulosilytica TaxID=986710 RepID=A0ABW2F506_9BACL